MVPIPILFFIVIVIVMKSVSGARLVNSNRVDTAVCNIVAWGTSSLRGVNTSCDPKTYASVLSQVHPCHPTHRIRASNGRPCVLV
jgi:hypothetical protein